MMGAYSEMLRGLRDSEERRGITWWPALDPCTASDAAALRLQAYGVLSRGRVCH
jgi:hypothetical protein